jgi:hypothetical protein
LVSGVGVVAVGAFDEAVELVGCAEGAGLDVLTEVGGGVAGLGCELGFGDLEGFSVS